jgi:polyhydroxybutyrate depolymerase
MILREKLLTFVLILILGSAACQRPAQTESTEIPRPTAEPGTYTVTLGPDADQRDVILHLPPAYDGSGLLPLLIVLHGGGGSGEQIHRQIGMDADADDFGFVVAYPNGSGRLGETLLTWNAGHCCAYSLDKNIDDVGFLSELIDQLLESYAIDPARVYVAGMSNGAMMAYRAGAELSEKIAGIAPVAGSIGGQVNAEHLAFSPELPAEPVAVIAFHGMQDRHVSYDGGVGPEAINQGRIDFSVEESIAFWVEANGCNPNPYRESHFDGNILIDDYYDDCLGNSAVVLVTIVDGGHAWPGAKSGVGDQPNQQISANEMILEFFMARPKISEE